MDALVGFVFLGGFAAAYLLPVIVAGNRHHPQTGPIAVVNVLLGWTLLGWVVALAWAVSQVKGGDQ